ncbi:SPEF1 protein, partial [Nothocercus nigrocapillus]|nr:SPEF1 protein [Nothocercus nigrocapillus]
VIRKIVQCRPGLVEQVLLLLRQKIEERQRQQQSRPAPGPPQVSDVRAACAGGSPCPSRGLSQDGGAGSCPGSLPRGRLSKGQHGASHVSPRDTSFHLQLAEREQALLLAQETIQVLQAKVRRLEQLLRLKNIRIEDLS